MKLWQKYLVVGEVTALQKKIEAFTIGSDKHWDIRLAEADVKGSLAHAGMLHSIGLLTETEYRDLMAGLSDIDETIRNGDFVIEEGVEDVHSQIELLLTRSKGDAGKKIHSGRSRNDQSLLDIKLYLRAELENTVVKTAQVFDTLLALSDKHAHSLLPGYTHMQLAMPSSFGLWFAAYAESLSDDLELLIAAYHVVNKNPLGSGAGYGSSFPLNRQLTTDLLGFSSMNYNVVYAQMTRGKTEKICAMALASIAATLARFATDVCLYMNQNFAFISFNEGITTGSSIMPHKKNPDVFELIRARCNRIQALPNELTLLSANLSSGYHRDMQLTKECLFPAITSLHDCLDILVPVLEQISVRESILEEPCYRNLFSVEQVNQLVLSGLPFRDAYRQVAATLGEGSPPDAPVLNHVHEGSIGNLCNDRIREEFYKKVDLFAATQSFSGKG